MKLPNVICSPTVKDVGDLFPAYCRGALSPTACGTNINDMVATDKWQTLKVSSLPYFTIVSNKKIYPACYYHIKVPDYEWRGTSKINVFVKSSSNTNIQVFGGRSLSNASIALNSGTNKTVKSGQLISVNAGTEAIILVYAKDYRLISSSFEINYAVAGE
jgi:hypothetical protein